jgi:hypothetical protein
MDEHARNRLTLKGFGMRQGVIVGLQVVAAALLSVQVRGPKIKVSAQENGTFTVTNARNGFPKSYGASAR